ncbi:MAG TPA: efflux RND transporter periplasmic adaptor subunit [Tepidisphaeraceae bacterium]|nr:efflux RND transporter periplasmic adaptor subunit [Tepidisphaeraceae bacterium]
MMYSRTTCAILFGLLFALNGCNKEGQASPQSGAAANIAPVMVAPVSRRNVPVEIRSIASVEPFATVTIRSRVAGELQKVHITPGQDVKKDDLLFEIDPRTFNIALHQAEANLERDTALANNAEVDAKRTGDLLAEHAATQEEADKARYTAQAAQATVRRDQAAVDDAKLQIEYSKIVSPVDGRTGSLMADVGNVITADTTQLLVVNQIKPLYVTFNVPEQDLEVVRKYFHSDKPPMVDVTIPPDTDVSETGELSFIDNRVDSDTGTIRLKGTFQNSDRRLWPGQFVQATLKLTVETGKLVIPTRAVQAGQQGPFVFVVKPDMTAELRLVTVGRAVGDNSVIESGINAGEQVVTDGQLGLKPGSRVAIRTVSTTGPTTQTIAP